MLNHAGGNEASPGGHLPPATSKDEGGPRPAGKGWKFSNFLTLFLKWGLALLFIFAGAVKLRDPRAFAQAISQYGLVPDGLIPILALGLPAVEVLAGLGLLVNLRGSLGAILVMLLLFIGVLGYAIAADLDIDCGCFTAAELAARGSVKSAFFQDLGFLAAALFLLRRRKFGGGSQGPQAPAPSPKPPPPNP